MGVCVFGVGFTEGALQLGHAEGALQLDPLQPGLAFILDLGHVHLF